MFWNVLTIYLKVGFVNPFCSTSRGHFILEIQVLQLWHILLLFIIDGFLSIIVSAPLSLWFWTLWIEPLIWLSFASHICCLFVIHWEIFPNSLYHFLYWFFIIVFWISRHSLLFSKCFLLRILFLFHGCDFFSSWLLWLIVFEILLSFFPSSPPSICFGFDLLFLEVYSHIWFDCPFIF